METIEVVHASQVRAPRAGAPSSRETVFESPDALVARFSIEGREVSPWHHHSERTLVGYLLSGRLRLDFGPHGDSKIWLSPGDAFRIPPGLIHRDNPLDSPEGATVLSVYLGGGPIAVNVEGPEGP